MNRTRPSFLGIIKLGAHQGPALAPSTAFNTLMETNQSTSFFKVSMWICGIRIGRWQ